MILKKIDLLDLSQIHIFITGQLASIEVCFESSMCNFHLYILNVIPLSLDKREGIVRNIIYYNWPTTNQGILKYSSLKKF